MFNRRLIYDEDAFTTSTPLENFTPERYIHKINIALTGEMVGAAAKIPPLLSTMLNPIEIRRLGSPIISILGAELWAFNALVLGKNPLTMAAGANINDTSRIYGLELPLQLPPGPPGQVTIKLNRTAITGVDTETITVAEVTNDTVLKTEYYHMVEIPYVLAAATGYGNFIDLPQPGNLQGVLLYGPTIPTVTAEAESIKKVMLVVDGRRIMEYTWDEMKADAKTGAGNASFDSPGDATVVDNYVYLDLSEDPITADHTVRLDIFAGTASDSILIIPVYLVPH